MSYAWIELIEQNTSQKLQWVRYEELLVIEFFNLYSMFGILYSIGFSVFYVQHSAFVIFCVLCDVGLMGWLAAHWQK